VQSEEKHQHAGGWIAPVMSGPVVMDVFKECWVEDLDLGGRERKILLIHSDRPLM